MKAQTKALLASIVVIALALTAVSGVTYSWWSDSENSEITINTGMLRVDTEVLSVDGITSVEINKPLPDTISIDGYAPTGEDDSIVIEYNIKFYNTIAAKYHLSASSSNANISVLLESDDLEIGGTGHNLPTGSDDTTPSKTGKVKITIKVTDFTQTNNGKILIRNEIAQEGVTIAPGYTYATTSGEFNNQLTSTGDVAIMLTEGTYEIGSQINANATVVGESKESSIIDTSAVPSGSGDGYQTYADGKTVLFKNLTVKLPHRNCQGIARATSLTFEDCIIEGGPLFLNGPSVVFKNCEFVNSADYSVWTYGAQNALFKNCSFENSGKAILIYKDGGVITQRIDVIGCEFNTDMAGMSSTIANLSCAAIEIHNYMCSVTLNTSNNIVKTGAVAFSGEWRIKAYEQAYGPVTVNGTKYSTTALDGKILTVENGKVTSIDGKNFYDKESFESSVTADTKDIVVDLYNDTVFDIEPYEQKPMGGTATETITINGNGNRLTFNNTNSDWNNVFGNVKLILNDLILDNAGFNADSGPWNSHDITFDCNVEMKNVVCENAVAFKKTVTLINVTIEDPYVTQDAYMVWICAGADVTMDGCTINGKSDVGKDNRAIAIKDQYIDNPGMTKLTVSNTTITSDKYAAVVVTSAGGAEITWTNNNIEGTQDSVNAVCVEKGQVTCSGCTQTTK